MFRAVDSWLYFSFEGWGKEKCSLCRWLKSTQAWSFFSWPLSLYLMGWRRFAEIEEFAWKGLLNYMFYLVWNLILLWYGLLFFHEQRQYGYICKKRELVREKERGVTGLCHVGWARLAGQQNVIKWLFCVWKGEAWGVLLPRFSLPVSCFSFATMFMSLLPPLSQQCTKSSHSILQIPKRLCN